MLWIKAIWGQFVLTLLFLKLIANSHLSTEPCDAKRLIVVHWGEERILVVVKICCIYYFKSLFHLEIVFLVIIYESSHLVFRQTCLRAYILAFWWNGFISFTLDTRCCWLKTAEDWISSLKGPGSSVANSATELSRLYYFHSDGLSSLVVCVCVCMREKWEQGREREYVSLSLFSNGVDLLSCLTAFSGNKTGQKCDCT